MNVNVIIDTSGSMSSMAKINIAFTLVKFCGNLSAIHKEPFSCINFIYYLLGNSDEPVLCKDNEINVSGVTELITLEKLFQRTGKDELNFLFLSDGRFPKEDVSKFLRISGNYPDMRFVPVAVGADADEYILKEISTYSKIFRPEDIMQAVEIFLSGSDKCPASADSIVPSVQSDVEGAWDA